MTRRLGSGCHISIRRRVGEGRPAARLVALTASLMLLLCPVLAGCSQTANTEQAHAEQVDQAVALRAELEAGCATEGHTPGTPEFQSCVGRASIPYANAGFSKAKVIHQGVKSGADSIRVYNAGMQLARTTALISDARLKQDIVKVGTLENGLPLYRFRYLGGTRQFVGVLAQEVAKVVPVAVETAADGFFRVDYQKLGTRMVTWQAWVDNAPRRAGRHGMSICRERREDCRAMGPARSK